MFVVCFFVHVHIVCIHVHIGVVEVVFSMYMYVHLHCEWTLCQNFMKFISVTCLIFQSLTGCYSYGYMLVVHVIEISDL